MVLEDVTELYVLSLSSMEQKYLQLDTGAAR